MKYREIGKISNKNFFGWKIKIFEIIWNVNLFDFDLIFIQQHLKLWFEIWNFELLVSWISKNNEFSFPGRNSKVIWKHSKMVFNIKAR